MEAGRLRERVSVERHVRTPDGAGGYTLTRQPLATLWAAVEPVRASPRGQDAGESVPVGRYRVTVRWHPDLRAGQVLTWRGLELDVLAVTPRYQEGLVELEAQARLAEDAA